LNPLEIGGEVRNVSDVDRHAVADRLSEVTV